MCAAGGAATGGGRGAGGAAAATAADAGAGPQPLRAPLVLPFVGWSMDG